MLVVSAPQQMPQEQSHILASPPLGCITTTHATVQTTLSALTVHEAMALNAMGADVVGMSLISNLAAGISKQPLSHDEVIETGKHAASVMTQVVGEFCGRIASRRG